MNRKRKSSNSGHLLYQAILTLKDAEECYRFFADLCADVELGALEQRFEIARLLLEGMSYNEILERTGASSATISRVNRTLTSGNGMQAEVFERLQPLEEE